MEGYLDCHIGGNIFSNTYYFIFHENTIIYCKTKGSYKLGQVHLDVC